MTSSKVIYLIATVVPFGFVLLAGAILIHRLMKQSTRAQAATARAQDARR